MNINKYIAAHHCHVMHGGQTIELYNMCYYKLQPIGLYYVTERSAYFLTKVFIGPQ